MDLLKALKRTKILPTAVCVLALGATQAYAVGNDQTAIIGHISASVVDTLTVKEVSAINFGNFIDNHIATPCVLGVPAAGVAAADQVVMDTKGVRTGGTGCLLPVYGTTGGGTTDGAGQRETGGQAPGFYTIAQTDGETNVYVSFADSNGDIVDSKYGSFGTGATVYTHPNNYVKLVNDQVPGDTMAVNEFTFETDNPAALYKNSGYTQLQPALWGADNSGNYVACGASCTLRVGAKLQPLTALHVGKYQGTFYVMVSY
jgi:hypothetical protein